MTKGIRVYELARELGVTSKKLLTILQEEMNITLNNHMATVNDQVANRLRWLVKGPSEGEGEKEREKAKKAEGSRPTDGAAKGSREAVKKEPSPSGATQGEAANGAARSAIRTFIWMGPMTVGELARQLEMNATDLMRRLIQKGVMAAINQTVTLEQVRDVLESMGIQVVDGQEPQKRLVKKGARPLLEGDDPQRAVPRAPVVTVLGHVDHGKTTLLDAIRRTRVAQGEAGGITQKIGASTVEWQGQKIVFLDTPGHEAFAAMRARGAQVTDVAVLVVAADDGVMPQTIEAIQHARSADVPIVVAITKMDREGANPERVKRQLAEQGLVPEEWGGDTVMVPVSAKRGEGIDDLLEMILLVAELLELKADPQRRAVGTVIEAQLDRSRGPVATVLVQTGTLKVGDPFVAGKTWGKVRSMMDDRGRSLKKAGPSTPVEILGFNEVPEAGDVFQVKASEKEARAAAEKAAAEEGGRQKRGITLAEFYRQSRDGKKELALIVKADTQGSLEALQQALGQLKVEDVAVTIVHGGVGGINLSDVRLAEVAGAVVLGFNVRPEASARQEAERAGVEIKTYRVIYELLDDVEKSLRGLLVPEKEEVVLGVAEVRQIFRLPGGQVAAGCYVQSGKMVRRAPVRVIRQGVIIHEGNMASLRRFKDDVREVAEGFECGITLEKFNDFKEGDLIECYEVRDVKA
ncbi:MAG: translation initiation factor IF-2 [Clostridiales bacterium]|nr:translation initiation factor IF-2 [Clostridiales bacterium]